MHYHFDKSISRNENNTNPVQRSLQKIVSMDEQPTQRDISECRKAKDGMENNVKGGKIYIYKGSARSFNKGEVEEEIGARRKGRIGC